MVGLDMDLSQTRRAEQIPRSRVWDDSVGFLLDGYRFGQRRFRRLDDDVFTTRLAGRPVTVMYGVEAARVFYEGDRFSRDRAMPTSVLHLLQDEESVQTLEGEPHHHREAMFMHMLQPTSVDSLVDAFDAEWTAVVARRRRTAQQCGRHCGDHAPRGRPTVGGTARCDPGDRPRH
jgi:hypothetical protein